MLVECAGLSVKGRQPREEEGLDVCDQIEIRTMEDNAPTGKRHWGLGPYAVYFKIKYLSSRPQAMDIDDSDIALIEKALKSTSEDDPNYGHNINAFGTILQNRYRERLQTPADRLRVFPIWRWRDI